jgi:hypothetical protein
LISVRQNLPRSIPRRTLKEIASDKEVQPIWLWVDDLLGHWFFYQTAIGSLPCSRHCARMGGAQRTKDLVSVTTKHLKTSLVCISTHVFWSHAILPFKAWLKLVQHYSVFSG